MTEFEMHALKVLYDHGPLRSSGVGDKVWPDRKFKNAQGAGFAGGCLMGKLQVKGLVTLHYLRWPGGELRFEGWVLTLKGKLALKSGERKS